MHALKAVLRFVAAVMIVSGVLLISDAGVTLAWEEPVSSFFANREQSRLNNQLSDPVVIKRVRERKPLRGDAIGKMSIPALKHSYYVVEGTNTADLRKGPGHYDDTPLPGQRGTTAIAGHRTTYGAPFRDVNRLKKGDRIVIEMPYGRITYRVERLKIVDPTDLSVKKRVSYNRLILSACHPLYSAAQRIIVFARQTGRDLDTTVK